MVAKQSEAKDMRTLAALAEPNRRLIVELLRNGPLTVGEIAEKLGFRQPQASKHLKVLTESGLLEVKAEMNKRFYKLRAEPFRELDVWVNSFLQTMTDRFDKLDEYLEKIKKNNKPSNRTKR